MESVSMRVDEQGRLIICGDLYRGNAIVLINYLRNFQEDAPKNLEVDLSQLDISDGTPMALLLNELRSLRKSLDSLVLIGAPQMLGHNLYRANLLEGPESIELREMREDEAYG